MLEPPTIQLLTYTTSSFSLEIKHRDISNQYVLHYKALNTDWMEMDIPAKNTIFTLQDLPCAQTYEVYLVTKKGLVCICAFCYYRY